MSENIEIWKPVMGYEGLYECSNLGNIRSLWFGKEKTMKLRTDRDGYLLVNFHKGKKQTTYKVHRLVAEAFIPNPENKPEIDHINTDKTDNTVWLNEDGSVNYDKTNLRWATKFENMNNPVTTNRMSTAKKNQEKGNHQTPIIQYDLNGNFIKQYPTIKEASMETGTYKKSISSCASGRYKTAGGFKWKYYDKETYLIGIMNNNIKKGAA